MDDASLVELDVGLTEWLRLNLGVGLGLWFKKGLSNVSACLAATLGLNARVYRGTGVDIELGLQLAYMSYGARFDQGSFAPRLGVTFVF